jgi:hypothetical protein
VCVRYWNHWMLDDYLDQLSVFLFVDVFWKFPVVAVANFGWCQMVHSTNIGYSEDSIKRLWVSKYVGLYYDVLMMFDILIINSFNFDRMAGFCNNLEVIFIME